MPKKKKWKKKLEEEHEAPCGCRECSARTHEFWFGTKAGEEPDASCHFNRNMALIAEKERQEKLRHEREELQRQESEARLLTQQQAEEEKSGAPSEQEPSPEVPIHQASDGEGDDSGLGQIEDSDEECSDLPADWHNTEVLETSDGEGVDEDGGADEQGG